VAIRICSERGKTLPTGEVGVVEVRGPNVFQGYWGMPEKTRAEFREDGYFITGDLGTLDEEGRLTLVGRDKDLIISGGLNVYPREVEMCLDSIDGIRESAVIGLPHPDFGEAVVAVCVAEGPSLPDDQALLDQLQHRLAKFKQPKAFIQLDNLPRNTMGKVQKNTLRDRYRDRFLDGAKSRDQGAQS
jgi:malonyl-CoA/methylmalonyl-CoA synthetase